MTLLQKQEVKGIILEPDTLVVHVLVKSTHYTEIGASDLSQHD